MSFVLYWIFFSSLSFEYFFVPTLDCDEDFVRLFSGHFLPLFWTRSSSFSARISASPGQPADLLLRKCCPCRWMDSCVNYWADSGSSAGTAPRLPSRPVQQPAMTLLIPETLQVALSDRSPRLHFLPYKCYHFNWFKNHQKFFFFFVNWNLKIICLPINEIFHAASDTLRKVGGYVFHLGDATFEFGEVALHGAGFHLTGGRGCEYPLGGFSEPTGARGAAAGLSLIREYLSAKNNSFYFKNASWVTRRRHDNRELLKYNTTFWSHANDTLTTSINKSSMSNSISSSSTINYRFFYINIDFSL